MDARWFSVMVISATLVLAACKGEEPPVLNGAEEKAAARNDQQVTPNEEVKLPACNWETPLVEGIPGSPGHPISSDVNPNGDSELGAMMRQMLADMQQLRQSAMNGEIPDTLPFTHQKLRCSWATDPGTRTETYDVMAVGYMEAFDKLADGEGDVRRRYGAVVTACLNCHATSCPGPTVAIEKLKLDL